MIGALVNDWTLTGVLTLQSGTPLGVTQTTNNNAFAGSGTQRPNLIADPTLPSNQRSVNRWFNTSAFVAAPAFAIGTSSRSPVRGLGYRNLDLAVMRRVPLTTFRGRPPVGREAGPVVVFDRARHAYSGMSALAFPQGGQSIERRPSCFAAAHVTATSHARRGGMGLTSGRRLGPYEVLNAVGAGPSTSL